MLSIDIVEILHVHVYILSDVIGQRLQWHVVECQVSQRSELREAIGQPEAKVQKNDYMHYRGNI